MKSLYSNHNIKTAVSCPEIKQECEKQRENAIALSFSQNEEYQIVTTTTTFDKTDTADLIQDKVRTSNIYQNGRSDSLEGCRLQQIKCQIDGIWL